MAIAASSPTSTMLILLTGATGHLGFRTLVHALREGLCVRVVVRSHEKGAQLLKQLSKKRIPGFSPARCEAAAPGCAHPRLSFAVVADITARGAYDGVMDDVTQVIHIASPLVTGGHAPPIDHELAQAFFIAPAVRGTTNMLEAAERCGTVRRVVITSSIAALIGGDDDVAARRGRVVRPTDRVPFTAGPYRSEFAAYANSKIAALDAAERWCAAVRPAFDVVHLHPSFVLGRNDMAAAPKDCFRGSNAMVLALLLGKRFGPFPGATVHVDDVARCHVAAAVDVRSVPGDASYILSRKAAWNDARDIAARHFGDGGGVLPLGGGGSSAAAGDLETEEVEVDASDAEATFGIRFKGYEAQVRSLVGQFVDLRTNGAGGSAGRRANGAADHEDGGAAAVQAMGSLPILV